MNERLYPELNSIEIINKKMKEVNSFDNGINNKNLISRFYEENHKKLKKKNNKFKNLNKILNTIDSLNFIGSTSTSISLSVTRFGLIVVPITAGVACGIAISTKLASGTLKGKEKYYLEKYTLAKNTVLDFRKMYQKN